MFLCFLPHSGHSPLITNDTERIVNPGFSSNSGKGISSMQNDFLHDSQ